LQILCGHSYRPGNPLTRAARGEDVGLSDVGGLAHRAERHITHRMRRILVAFLLLILADTGYGQAVPEDLTRALEGPISKGLAYLARQQQPDGSFQNRDPE